MAAGILQVAAPVRVMIVDDSAIVRGFTARIFENDPEVRIVASCGNGEIALREIRKRPCDVVILDIEMPVMDGLTALPRLLAAVPGVKILMSSTLTQRNAEISLEALSRGAADYVPKPSTNQIGGNLEFTVSRRGKSEGAGAAQDRARPSRRAGPPGRNSSCARRRRGGRSLWRSEAPPAGRRPCWRC